jgi:hypothetical protein
VKQRSHSGSWIAVIGIAITLVRSAQADHRQHPKAGVARPDGADVGVSLEAELDCSPLAVPGRVQCLVHLRPVGGTLHYSDALVIAAPPFAVPVRERVREEKRSDGAGADLPLTLTAIGDGEGELYVMGRATVCGARGCRPVQAEASARVVVGASGSAP